MPRLIIKSIDTRGLELHVLVGKDGTITATTPNSNFPPNDLVVATLPDGLVPDTATERVIELRGKRITPEKLIANCSLAIHGWLLSEWASFGVETFEACLGRTLRAIEDGHGPSAAPPLPPIKAGSLDPEFGSKLVAQVMGYLESWQTANR
jgi:hypothetical protein